MGRWLKRAGDFKQVRSVSEDSDSRVGSAGRTGVERVGQLHRVWHPVDCSGTNWSSSCQQNQFHEVILSRLCIGHTRLTHHLLRGDEPPLCDDCFAPLTVCHFLTECPTYMMQRGNSLAQMVSLNLFLCTSFWEMAKMQSWC